MNPNRFLLCICIFILSFENGFAENIASFSISLEKEEMVIDFGEPMAVDSIRIPVVNDDLWGSNQVGKVVVVRSEHYSNLSTRKGDDDSIVVDFREPSSKYLKIIPILSEKGEKKIKTDWKIDGKTAHRRRLELQISVLVQRTFDCQIKDRCFSCHRTLPLAFTVAAAHDRGFRLPLQMLASVTADLVSMQNPDGSFSFPAHPEYGVITPTLCAGVILGLFQRFAPDSGAALVKTARFLCRFQKPNGGISLDFSFPSFLKGKACGTWLLLRVLQDASFVFIRESFRDDPSISEAIKKAIHWFNNPESEGMEKDFFTFISLPVVGTFPDEDFPKIIPKLRKIVEEFSFARNPEYHALTKSVLFSLGLSEGNSASRIPINEFQDDYRLIFWRTYLEILNEPAP